MSNTVEYYNCNYKSVAADVQDGSGDTNNTLVVSLHSKKHPPNPLILTTDCVYFEHLFEPLFHTLTEFTRLGCIVLMCHVRRWKRDNKFFAMCKKTMNIEVLKENIEYLPHEHTGILHRNITRIYKFSYKISS